MTVSVGLEHDAIGVGRDDRRGFLRSHLILGGLRASADEADDLYVTQVGASPLAKRVASRICWKSTDGSGSSALIG